jgi:hypothetical protein
LARASSVSQSAGSQQDFVAARYNLASQHIAQQRCAERLEAVFKFRVGDYFAIRIADFYGPVAMHRDAFMVALGSAFARRGRNRLGLTLARCSGGFGGGLSRSAIRLCMSDAGHAKQENGHNRQANSRPGEAFEDIDLHTTSMCAPPAAEMALISAHCGLARGNWSRVCLAASTAAIAPALNVSVLLLYRPRLRAIHFPVYAQAKEFCRFALTQPCGAKSGTHAHPFGAQIRSI